MKTELKTSKTNASKKKNIAHNEFLWGTFISVLFVGGFIVTLWVLMWNLWLSR